MKAVQVQIPERILTNRLWYDPTSGNYTIIASSEVKASDRSLSYPLKRHADGFNDWVLVADGH
ncbi:MAG: hypothetical protein DME19_04970 [Verrucomicrobia bacterium]|nr:MAG: hypothetical protein DME19_04970 [Verrucomicrobiota bacterium]